MTAKETEWCPAHGYPLPCDKCGFESGVKFGRKEVVEFLLPYIEEHRHMNILDIVGIPFDKWESKLKEWDKNQEDNHDR